MLSACATALPCVMPPGYPAHPPYVVCEQHAHWWIIAREGSLYTRSRSIICTNISSIDSCMGR